MENLLVIFFSLGIVSVIYILISSIRYWSESKESRPNIGLYLIILFTLINGTCGVYSSNIIVIILFIICDVAYFPFVVYHYRNAKKQQETTKKLQEIKDDAINSTSLSFHNGVLSLKKRHPGLKQFLLIVKENDYGVFHKPEELHIGSVTVGGITTGGTYTTGGYDYASGIQSSGKYSLRYLSYKKSETINKIELSPELFQKAMTSPIAKYLNPNTKQIMVVENVNFTRDELDILRNFAYGRAGGNSWVVHKGYPSFAKCSEILNWLAQADN